MKYKKKLKFTWESSKIESHPYSQSTRVKALNVKKSRLEFISFTQLDVQHEETDMWFGRTQFTGKKYKFKYGILFNEIDIPECKTWEVSKDRKSNS